MNENPQPTKTQQNKSNVSIFLWILVILIALALIGSYVYTFFTNKNTILGLEIIGEQGPQGDRGPTGLTLNEGPKGEPGPQGSLQVLSTYILNPITNNTSYQPNQPYVIFPWNWAGNGSVEDPNIVIFAAFIPFFLNSSYPLTMIYNHYVTNTINLSYDKQSDNRVFSSDIMKIPSSKSFAIFGGYRTASCYTGFDWKVIRTDTTSVYPTSFSTGKPLQNSATYVLIYVNYPEELYFRDETKYLGIIVSDNKSGDPKINEGSNFYLSFYQ